MYEAKELKPYKGYGVSKVWEVDDDGKRVGPYKYTAYDNDEYIGEECNSIAEVHRFIDSII